MTGDDGRAIEIVCLDPHPMSACTRSCSYRLQLQQLSAIGKDLPAGSDSDFNFDFNLQLSIFASSWLSSERTPRWSIPKRGEGSIYDLSGLDIRWSTWTSTAILTLVLVLVLLIRWILGDFDLRLRPTTSEPRTQNVEPKNPEPRPIPPRNLIRSNPLPDLSCPPIHSSLLALLARSPIHLPRLQSISPVVSPSCPRPLSPIVLPVPIADAAVLTHPLVFSG